MKILRQKVNKLEVAARYGEHLYNQSPEELLLKRSNNFTFPCMTFSKGSKFEIVECIEDGFMDGRGEKHLLRYVHPQLIPISSSCKIFVYVFRGSLSRAFDIIEE